MSAPLVNRTRVRRFVADYAASIGRGEVITQVTAEVFDHLKAAVRRKLVAMIERHPSAFKTLKP